MAEIMPSGVESHVSEEFITAVPAGATSTGTFGIPKGWYFINVYGTHAAAGTDPTFLLQRFLTSAQSSQSTLGAAFNADTTMTFGAVDMELADSVVSMNFSGSATLLGARPVYVPHGLKWTYTKSGGTAVNLSFSAMRVG